MPLETIRALAAADLTATDQFIINQLASNIPMVKDMVEYVLTCGGKRIRPLVLLLSAKALNPQVRDHINLAAVIELIHTATLLHDDVVDHSNLRRGHDTANVIWGPDASVLVGDFLYSRAFQIVVELQQPTILDIFAKATHYIAEGEILQLVNSKNPETTAEFYYDIIDRKTAKLFEIAAQLGGIQAAPTQTAAIASLQIYGRHLGLAYQLIDDAIDYSQSADVAGKNVGQDIADGKTTLPLLYAMQNCSADELSMIKAAIADGDTSKLEEIIAIIARTGAIEYTASAAREHAHKAQAALQNLPTSDYQRALWELSQFVVERNY